MLAEKQEDRSRRITVGADKACNAKDFVVDARAFNAIDASGHGMPRVMNVDKNPAYPAAVEALKAEGAIPHRVALRQCKYLNNVIEQDHRTVTKRVWLAKGYGSFRARGGRCRESKQCT